MKKTYGEKVLCDQLILNDISASGDEIICELFDTLLIDKSVKVLNGQIVIKQLQKQIMGLLDGYEDILLIGKGSNIVLSLLDKGDKDLQEMASCLEAKGIRINPTRKIGKGLLPRGISIPDEDVKILQGLNNKSFALLEDVVASGSTINKIQKLTGLRGSKEGFLEGVSLVGRSFNDVKDSDKLLLKYGVEVDRTGGGYPNINTLSTMVDGGEKSILARSYYISKGISAALYDETMSKIAKIK